MATTAAALNPTNESNRLWDMRENDTSQADQQCTPFRIFSRPEPLWLDVHPGEGLVEARSSRTGRFGIRCHGFRNEETGECSNRTTATTTSSREATVRPLWSFKFPANSSLEENGSNHHHVGPMTLPTTSSSSYWRLIAGPAAYDFEYTPQERQLPMTTTVESDLSRPRHVWIVTSAALPWMTGTAINPLLRAAHLWKFYNRITEEQERRRQEESQADFEENNGNIHNLEQTVEVSDDTEGKEFEFMEAMPSDDFSITLVVPWLSRVDDRTVVYGEGYQHMTQDSQEALIRQWLVKAGMPQPAKHINIQWYNAQYSHTFHSIFASEDVCAACQNVPATDAVCVLEEPEHVNVYKFPGAPTWSQKFSFVVGIVHTNYRAYALASPGGIIAASIIGNHFSILTRCYCDKIIKLSPVLEEYAPEKESTENVHGIRGEFLCVPPPSGRKLYFIGKLLWTKGLDKLLQLQDFYQKLTGEYFAMDIYGSGPDEKEIQEAYLGYQQSRQMPLGGDEEKKDDEEREENVMLILARQRLRATLFRRQATALPVDFKGRKDHARLSSEYKIFVNPSLSEVLCTTTAEAIAMGKFAIIPDHPSNKFFKQFPNCLQYRTKHEFFEVLRYAMAHQPAPLLDKHRAVLTWEDATLRFIQASAVTERDAERRNRVSRDSDERLSQHHQEVMCKANLGQMYWSLLYGEKQPQHLRS